MQVQAAVVTGGSKGLGLAIARRLLQDGAEVCLWDVDASGLQEAKESLGNGSNVHTVVADVTSEKDVQRAWDETFARFGPVSILVNNAGIPGPHARSWEVPLDEWQKTLSVNLTGVFLCCKAFVPEMLEADYGRIVNIASISGKEASPFISSYASSKGGVIAFTKTLGRELAHTQITANCIAPAAIRTAIFDRWPDEYVAELRGKIPMGRFGTPEELASLVSWVSSREASFTTGAVLDLSGGRADY